MWVFWLSIRTNQTHWYVNPWSKRKWQCHFQDSIKRNAGIIFNSFYFSLRRYDITLYLCEWRISSLSSIFQTRKTLFLINKEIYEALTDLRDDDITWISTLFQNGRHFSILLFTCKLAVVPSFKVPITPKSFFRWNKSLHLFETHCAFLLLFNPNIDLLQAVKVTKSGHHLK